MQPAIDSEDIARRFDDRAEHYDDSAFHRALATAAVQFAGTDGVHSILDIATGTGLVLRSLPRGSMRMVGVDVSSGMVDVARRSLPDAELIVGDASAGLDLPDASFDLITCVTALHLLPDPTEAVRSWRRLLAAGGRVVVAVFRTDEAGEVPEVAEARRRGGERHPHGENDHLHARVGTPEAMERLAAAAGFTVTRSQTWVQQEPLELCLLAELTPRS